MTPPATATASPKTERTPSPEAAILDALAAAGESLTYAIVHHDLDAIVAATREAELLMAKLTTRDAVRQAAATIAAGHADEADDRARDPEPSAPDPAVLLLGARIGATARRNALLLEHAWATDAALLRLLATAARNEVQAASGSGYGTTGAQAGPDTIQAGWLDRKA